MDFVLQTHKSWFLHSQGENNDIVKVLLVLMITAVITTTITIIIPRKYLLLYPEKTDEAKVAELGKASFRT